MRVSGWRWEGGVGGGGGWVGGGDFVAGCWIVVSSVIFGMNMFVHTCLPQEKGYFNFVTICKRGKLYVKL